MPTFDPATGRELSDSAIQRVLFVNNDVHVYQIPPITSNKGFAAGSWTDPTKPMAQQIFTARLRVFETSVNGKIKADIVLEDGKTGDLFAAAPYTSTAVVQPANDSSRFFAIRVQGEGGMKATLGIGFEDRSPAFDFGIALSEVRKVLGMNDNAVGSSSARGNSTKASTVQELKQDFSLKEGEKIHILVGSRGRRNAPENTTAATPDDGAALFSIAPPPPPGGKAQTIAPPPSAKSTQESGFDDDFGEFQ